MQNLIKTAPTPNLSPNMNRFIGGLRTRIGKPPPLAPQLPPNPAKQNLAARQSRLLRTGEGGDEMYKQYSYLGGFLAKLAGDLGQEEFEELSGKVGIGDWNAKGWADLKPATQTALTTAVGGRLKLDPKLLQHVQAYTGKPNPYSRWTSPIRYNVYNRVQKPGFWDAVTKQFPQLVAKE